ncbi:MAG: DNA repair protein RecO [Actinomycetota bacterium]|nr:DNA repair protein RecO [Actinomycetota bacterium]
MGLYRERGIVLRTIKLGEADRIVTLVTEGHGKLRAVAKGVRRTKSRFGARVEPLSHVALLCYEGRSLDTITQAEALEHFRPVREDLGRLSRGLCLLEVVDSVVQEGDEDPRLYQMLLGALRALAAGEAPLLVPAFFWKLLAQQGFRPSLDACATCGAAGAEALEAFDPGEGGVLCRSCRRGTRITPDALALLRRILGGDLVGVLAEGASPAGAELEHLATRAIEHHLERRLRAPGLLDPALSLWREGATAPARGRGS